MDSFEAMRQWAPSPGTVTPQPKVLRSELSPRFSKVKRTTVHFLAPEDLA
jgi:hypothetical protein